MSKRVLFLLTCLLSCILMLLLVGRIMYTAPEGNTVRLSDGWMLELDGELLVDDYDLESGADLPGTPYRQGQTLTLTRVLPELTDVTFPSLQIKTQYSGYRIYLSPRKSPRKGNTRSQLLLEDQTMEALEGRFVGCGYHFISLPRDYAGKSLTIELIAADNDPFSSFMTPLMGSHHDLENIFVYNNLFPIATAIFLILFGGAFLFITTLFYSSASGILVQLFSALLYTDLGVWLLSYYNVTSLFMNGRFATFSEYISLYLIIPLSLQVLLCLSDHARLPAFRVFTIVCGLTPVLFIFLHLARVIYMNKLLPIYHVICLLVYVSLVAMMIRDIRVKKIKSSDLVQTLGLFLFSSAIILDMAFYVLIRSGIIGHNMITDNLLPAGALMFVFAELLNYFTYISESYARGKEYQTLTRMAYADGLPQRTLYGRPLRIPLGLLHHQS